MTTMTKKQVQKIIDAADAVITAMAGTNDDVHPDNHSKMCQLYDELNDRYATPEIVRELARIALQSLDAEPIAWTDNDELGGAKKGYSAYLFAIDGEANKFADPRRKIMLYTAPPVQPELVVKLKKVMNSWLAMERKLAFQPEFADVMMLLDAEPSLAQPVSEPYKLPELNDELIEILGRPNFTCTKLAEYLRHCGQDIKRKSEYEQAAVLHVLLNLYIKHGNDWRKHAEEAFTPAVAQENE